MEIDNDKLPEIASNGFFCKIKRCGYSRYVALAPIKETAKRLYCCEVITKSTCCDSNCDIKTYVEIPTNKFCRDWQGSAHVYVVPKGNYPKTHKYTVDWGR